MGNMKWLMLVGVLFFINCNSTSKEIFKEESQEKIIQKNQNSNDRKVIWINSAKVDCVGVAPMSCMQVKENDNLNEGSWEYFYDTISGFDYQPGYLYKLEVAVENLDPSEIPADASSKHYKLVKIIQKEKDKRMRVNDIWVLKTLNSKPIKLNKEEERPRLEINLAQNKIFGKGVCNQMFASIKTITETEISFGNIGSTLKMCLDNMKLEDDYMKLLKEVKNYTIEKNQLILKNGSHEEILRFQKVD